MTPWRSWLATRKHCCVFDWTDTINCVRFIFTLLSVVITCLLVCSEAAQLAARTALLVCRIYTEYVVWKSHVDSAAGTGLCPPLAAERRSCRLTRRSLTSTASPALIGHSGRCSALIGRLGLQDGLQTVVHWVGGAARKKVVPPH